MAGAMLAQVRSYERMTSDGESLREITRVYECWADCLFAGFLGIFRADAGGLVREMVSVYERSREFTSEAGFAGFLGIFRMAGAMLAQVRSYERMTSDGESLREITRGYECWADCLKQDLQDFLGFSGWRGSRGHRCACTRDGERLREITRVYECWADCLKQDLQDFLGLSGWRGSR